MKPYIFVHSDWFRDFFLKNLNKSIIVFSSYSYGTKEILEYSRFLATNPNCLLSRQDYSRWKRVGDEVTKEENGLFYLGACVTALPSSC